MPETIETITLRLPLRMGKVNCYLIGTGSERVLDRHGPREGPRLARVGPACRRVRAWRHLAHRAHACRHRSHRQLRDLKNAFNTKIAMHPEEVPAVTGGDLTETRSNMSPGKRRLAKMGGS